MSIDDDRGERQPPTTAAADSAATAIGPAADETAIVPPLAAAPPALAWSRDEDDDTAVSWGAAARRAGIILVAAVAVALVIGLLTWLGFSIYGKTKPIVAGRATKPSATLPAAAPAPPPSTVTITPAPAPTVTVQAAPPPPVRGDGVAPPPAGDRTDVFTICPDGHEGVVGGHTSCAFAENVRRIFYATGMSDNFTAFSPVTGEAYEMTCVGRYPAFFDDGSTMISTRCYGGDDAEVVIW
ncbi:hypothetical protein [Mycobacterium servetii]|uniref:Serine/threonine protein kinase n=1 Tax=Mycobacterium servetii TaxID=3237418 RepID=A0ABV4C3A1_9MYCO